jgi:hypothetical protein
MTRSIVDEIEAELVWAGRRRKAVRRRRLTVTAVCTAVLPFAAVGVAQMTTGDPLAGLDVPALFSPDANPDHRVDLAATLPDGTAWTASVYLGDSGRTACLSAPAQGGARWPGVGCLGGGVLADRFQSEPPAVVSAVGVVRGADGGRTAVVYGYVDARSRVSAVTTDGVASDAIHLSARTLTLPVVIPDGALTAVGRERARTWPSQLELQPFVATVPLASDAAGEATVSVVGPDGQTHVQHVSP